MLPAGVISCYCDGCWQAAEIKELCVQPAHTFLSRVKVKPESNMHKGWHVQHF